MRATNIFGRGVFLLFFISILHIFSCSEESKKEKVLASVGQETLAYTDAIDMIPKGNAKDSLENLRSYVESWVRDRMILEKAKKEVRDNKEIMQLTEKYRESLLLHHYKKKYIGKRLDSFVSDTAKINYYERNKSQFNTEQKLYNILFLKFSTLHPSLSEFQAILDDENKLVRGDLKKFCDVGITQCMIDSNIWVTEDFIISLFEKEAENVEISFTEGESSKHVSNDSHYFLYVEELIEKGETAPYSSVENKIRDILLHREKLRVSEDLERDIYESGLRNGWIKINVE